MHASAALGKASGMGRIEEAAKHAARQYRWGRVRFYIALVGLGVVSVASAVVAVAYAWADAPDADQAVAAGLVGTVTIPAVGVWGVYRFSGASRQESFRKITPLLLLAALLVIGIGLWQMAVGNVARALWLIVLAVGDVVVVAAVTRRGSNGPGG